MKMKKSIVGVIIMVVAVVGILGWEIFGREQLLFTDVLVLNEDTEAYTQITESDLATKKVYQPNKKSYTISDAKKVIGKQTTQFIPKGAELNPRYFEDSSLVVNDKDNEFVYSLNVNGLKAYPVSIYKGDTIHIFAADNYVLKTTVLGIRDSNGNEVTQSKDRAQISAQIATIEIKVTGPECETLSYLISNSEPLTISYN